uniref:Uncharacterized protein n=1 Tax=Myotis myotis TaxID=51298 RepID=A0A7J7Z4M3_MYOMY|nr:hypothetical protein mMyoMyo1_010404 [Myotis myotis]
MSQPLLQILNPWLQQVPIVDIALSCRSYSQGSISREPGRVLFSLATAHTSWRPMGETLAPALEAPSAPPACGGTGSCAPGRSGSQGTRTERDREGQRAPLPLQPQPREPSRRRKGGLQGFRAERLEMVLCVGSILEAPWGDPGRWEPQDSCPAQGRLLWILASRGGWRPDACE